ncbi:hypothetical protein Nepgr_013452 [Nepenthes gracilis]|uniref:Uncharacterized protein n=1 Tax=Nepenthes gracilis TaxID=150966 RepID=A0AAD3XPC3_NEPGR|nr:hypothetical protein Nepgr_013452 [Nepenthes gracilis]
MLRDLLRGPRLSLDVGADGVLRFEAGAGIWTCLGGAAGILSSGCCGWIRWDTAAGMDVLSLLEAAEMLLMLEPFRYADARLCLVLFYGLDGPGWNLMHALSGAEHASLILQLLLMLLEMEIGVTLMWVVAAGFSDLVHQVEQLDGVGLQLFQMGCWVVICAVSMQAKLCLQNVSMSWFGHTGYLPRSCRWWLLNTIDSLDADAGSGLTEGRLELHILFCTVAVIIQMFKWSWDLFLMLSKRLPTRESIVVEELHLAWAAAGLVCCLSRWNDFVPGSSSAEGAEDYWWFQLCHSDDGIANASAILGVEAKY